MANDAGSAVVEFCLLALPLCLMTISATNHSINVYSDTLLRAAAISTARFASLADTSLRDANSYAAKVCLNESFAIKATCHVEITSDELQRAVAHFSYEPLSLLFYQPEVVTISATKSLEIAKR